MSDFEPSDFENDLRQSLRRVPAPQGLKAKILQQRRRQRAQTHPFPWQRLAASLLLTAVVAGGYALRQREERREGEQARQQVLTALRITGRALNQMNAQLAARDREP
jgi:hypothetical protein